MGFWSSAAWQSSSYTELSNPGASIFQQRTVRNWKPSPHVLEHSLQRLVSHLPRIHFCITTWHLNLLAMACYWVRQIRYQTWVDTLSPCRTHVWALAWSKSRSSSHPPLTRHTSHTGRKMYLYLQTQGITSSSLLACICVTCELFCVWSVAPVVHVELQGAYADTFHLYLSAMLMSWSKDSTSNSLLSEQDKGERKKIRKYRQACLYCNRTFIYKGSILCYALPDLSLWGACTGSTWWSWRRLDRFVESLVLSSECDPNTGSPSEACMSRLPG